MKRRKLQYDKLILNKMVKNKWFKKISNIKYSLILKIRREF